MKATSNKRFLNRALVLVLVLLVGVSTLLWWVDPGIKTWGEAMWWGITTLTTVGYGDVVPVTSLGMVLGSVLVILSVLVFSLGTAMISIIFINEELNQEEKELLRLVKQLQRQTEAEEHRDMKHVIERLDRIEEQLKQKDL